MHLAVFLTAKCDNTSLQELSNKIYLELINKNYQAVFDKFDESVKSTISVSNIQKSWEQYSVDNLKADKVEFSINQMSEDIIISEKEIKFTPDVKVNLRLVFNQKTKLVGLYLIPLTTDLKLPSFLNKNNITEEETHFESDKLKISCKLTQSKHKSTKHIVILVHGSGPQTMDVQVGPNKFFRDLAYGLANQGIDVLRYHKRTFEHKEKLMEYTEFTVKDEFVNDAVSAVEYLIKRGYKKDHITILGHSQSGNLLAVMDEELRSKSIDISSYIMLSGSPRKLQDLIVEQIKYISSLDGNIDNAEKANIKAIEDVQTSLKDISKLPKDMAPLGLPLTYWNYYEEVKPSEKMKEIQKPLLVVGGGKDYQVTKEDFNLWKDMLSDKMNVEFKYFRNLNHIYFEVKGKPSPADYQVAGFVSEDLIEILTEWILSIRNKK